MTYNAPRKTPEQFAYANWRQPEHIRWALRNFSFIPTVMVPRAGAISELAAGPSHDVEAMQFEYMGEETTMLEAMVGDCVDGYLVIKDNKILYERYFEDFGQHDHHLWASATKSLVATAFGILADKFDIDENASPAKYLTELEGSAFSDVTLRNVLNMVTALDYTEDYDNMPPGSATLDYFLRLGFVPAFDLAALDPLKDDTPRGVRSLLSRFERRADGKIGAAYEYQSPNVDVIGWLIERVSGQTLQDFITENIWSKLGAEHDAFMATDLSMAPIATGGMNSTLRDAARFGLMALNEGEFAGERIVPEAWARDSYSLTDADKEAGAASVYCDEDRPEFYGFLEGYRSFWWVLDSAAGERKALGIHGQVIYINKAKNVVITYFSSPEKTGNSIRPSFKKLFAGTRALAQSL